MKATHRLISNLTRLLRDAISSSRDDFTFFADDGRTLHLSNNTDVGLYIHVPFCAHLCPYCPYYRVHFREDLTSPYFTALNSEVNKLRERIASCRINSLYIGGGTPTLVLEQLGELLNNLRRTFSVNGPVAIETIPSEITNDKSRLMKQVGVDFVSIGVQSFQNKFLDLLGRDYDRNKAQEAIGILSRDQFNLINVDMMFAFPSQTTGELMKDLRKVVAYRPQQVTCYPLFTFPYSAVGRYRRLQKLCMPDHKLRRKMYYIICTFFLERGYRQSSVWSFTRDTNDSYSSVSRDYYIGLGPSAGSYTGEAFYFNTFSLKEYIKTTGSRLPIALKMKVSPRLEKLFWLYWRLYETVIPDREFQRRFDSKLPWDFKLLQNFLKFIGFGSRISGRRFVLKPAGAHWIHLLQNQYALNYVNSVWTKCQSTPWPRKVKL